jgi:hypothetical protein
MAMTKQPEGIRRRRADLARPPQQYDILLHGSPIGRMRRVAPGSRAWWAHPLDGHPWERLINHTMAEEYLAAPAQRAIRRSFVPPM